MKDRTKGDQMTQDECWNTEHIDIQGHLSVPVESAIERSPKREGWKPFFVTTHLDRRPQKNVKYKRVDQ